jgi:hypothetical protein
MDTEGACDVGQSFAGFPASERFTLLVWSELGTSSKLHASSYRSRPTFSRSRANQLTLELSQSSENSQHQSTVWRRRIGPHIPKRSKSGFSLSDLGQDVQQITSGSGKTIQPRDDHRVALLDGVEKLPELRPVSPSTTGLFPKDFGAPGGFQVPKLCIQ